MRVPATAVLTGEFDLHSIYKQQQEMDSDGDITNIRTYFHHIQSLYLFYFVRLFIIPIHQDLYIKKQHLIS